MHENSEKINFIKIVFFQFSCILSFVDMLVVLSTYLLRLGTQVPVGGT